MQLVRRRKSVALILVGLLAGILPMVFGAPSASAATVVTPNSCTNNVQTGTSQLDITLSGDATPNPATLGVDDVTLSGATFGIDVPGSVLLSGYGLNLLQADTTQAGSTLDPATGVFTPGGTGINSIPATVNFTLLATNASVPSQSVALSVTGTTTITDPTPILPGDDGIFQTLDPTVNPITALLGDDKTGRASGDEVATPLSVTSVIPLTTWTPTGGDLSIRLGNSSTTALVGPGGVLAVQFDCQPGTPTPAGCNAVASTVPCTGTNAVPAAPFTTVTVNAPATPPVCSNVATSVGANQSTSINITFGGPGSGATCTDINGNIDPASFVVVDPLSPDTASGGGTLTPDPGGTPGAFTYDAPANDPGPVTFTFQVSDSTPEASNIATVTITVLANQCDATVGPCPLQQILVQPVVGASMTMSKVPGTIVMPPVFLNGQPQVAESSIQDITVTNARGSAAGWNVNGYITDLGTPGSPTVDATAVGGPPNLPACSVAGSAGGASGPFGGGDVPDRNCIPGDNVGWNPVADVAHDRIGGDVAHVLPGFAHAIGDGDWLAQLIAAGSAAPATDTPPSVVPSPNGLGGLGEANILCFAPDNQSGGTFACDAAIYVGVPASAAEGNFAGGLVLTLI